MITLSVFLWSLFYRATDMMLQLKTQWIFSIILKRFLGTAFKFLQIIWVEFLLDADKPGQSLLPKQWSGAAMGAFFRKTQLTTLTCLCAALPNKGGEYWYQNEEVKDEKTQILHFLVCQGRKMI